MFSVVNEKLNKAYQLVEVRKSEPACDDECKAKCDAEADEMIREVKNPLHDITWNCKNNYDVYTTDYDPNNSHFDRISSDVLDVQKALVKIENLEKKFENKKSNWNWREDLNNTDFEVLQELKKEMGLEGIAGQIKDLNVREAIEKAVETHAQPDHSNAGFTKAYGLENTF